jgi:hypothetical protein
VIAITQVENSDSPRNVFQRLEHLHERILRHVFRHRPVVAERQARFDSSGPAKRRTMPSNARDVAGQHPTRVEEVGVGVARTRSNAHFPPFQTSDTRLARSVAVFFDLEPRKENATGTRPPRRIGCFQRKGGTRMINVGMGGGLFFFLAAGAVSLFSFLSLAAWVEARKSERLSVEAADALPEAGRIADAVGGTRPRTVAGGRSGAECGGARGGAKLPSR